MINGDDFGMTESCTGAICLALRKGLITHTTMLANGGCFEQAVVLAREQGFVEKIGWHINLTEGEPLTEAMARCPLFVRDGRFHKEYLKNPRALTSDEQNAVVAELTAQANRLRDSGIPFCHADSHHYIHTYQFIAPLVAQVCRSFGVEQIRRITGQVEMICQSSGRKKTSFEQDQENTDNDYLLSKHDTIETVIRAAEKLGYDLNTDDQQKIWKSFCQAVEKKENISLKELDAIIAAEAMQVPPAYHDVRYAISTGNQIGAMAHMKLMFHNQEIEGIASGDGAIDAAFNSVEQATGRHFELDDFQIRSVTEGREAMGETVVRLRWEGKLYSGRGISTDIVGAGIMAYINAVNKIVYEEEEA